MKKHNKILSFLLTLAMVMSLNVTAFAAEETYTITINNDKTGHTYEAYQIFTGKLSNNVLSDIQWGTGISEEGKAALQEAYKAETADGVAEAIAKENNAAAFADKAAAYLTEEAATSIEGEGTYTISGLKPGYYLVKDRTVSGNDAYTDYIVEVVENSTVDPKSSIPSVEKKVQENSTEAWQDAADYNIGDNVPFKLTATLGSNLSGYETYKLVFHDELSNGLAFNNDVKVTVGEKVLNTGDFSVVSSGNQLTVTIDDVLKHGAEAGSKVTVEYTAKLNENAVIGSAGNPNKVTLEFSNNPNSESTGTTPEDKVIVFTYQLDVNKTDGEKPLAGAGFTLYRQEDSGWVKVGEEVKGEDMTSFTWEGLDAGHYKLVETTTPAGYNTMKDIEFDITASYDLDSADPQLKSLNGGDLFTGEVSTGVLTGTVVNNAGSTLPETGGMGTKLFYGLGGILVAGAAILLVAKKRMKDAE